MLARFSPEPLPRVSPIAMRLASVAAFLVSASVIAEAASSGDTLVVVLQKQNGTRQLQRYDPRRQRAQRVQSTRIRGCRGSRLGHSLILFPPFGDELIGTLLYLFGGQRSASPVDSFAVRVDAINVQRFSGALSSGHQN